MSSKVLKDYGNLEQVKRAGASASIPENMKEQPLEKSIQKLIPSRASSPQNLKKCFSEQGLEKQSFDQYLTQLNFFKKPSKAAKEYSKIAMLRVLDQDQFFQEKLKQKEAENLPFSS